MPDWTVQINTGAGFVSHEWLDLGFDLQLNQLGRFHCQVLPESTEADEGDEIKIIWDSGGAQERVWFRGKITHKDKDDLTEILTLQGYDDAFDLYQSRLGDARSWTTQTPYTTIQSAGSPKGLLYNSQSTLVMAYATTAPNAITGGSPGNTLTFRASRGMNLLNIGRLCEQATHGGTPTYGLEWFVDRSGADAKQFNLVTRRERAAVYTAESFQIGVDLDIVRRDTNREDDYDRVRVVGEGLGSERVESTWAGTGSREFVMHDKSITDTTTATNLANRIKNALTGSTDRLVVDLHDIDIDTNVGDDVDIVSLDGLSTSTVRCFGINYEFARDSIQLELGRSRRFFTSILRDIAQGIDGSELHDQKTDLKPTQPISAGTTVNITAAANQAVNAGATVTLGTVAANAAHANADGFMLLANIQVDDGAGADFSDTMHWEIDLDGTAIFTFTTSGIKAGQDYKHRATWPFGHATATTFSLKATNQSGAVNARAVAATVNITEKPRFRMNA